MLDAFEVLTARIAQAAAESANARIEAAYAIPEDGETNSGAEFDDYGEPLWRSAPPPPVPTDRPVTWSDYVGQQRVRLRLEVAVASAKARNERCEHILLLSPPGYGKTSLGSLIAAELERSLTIMTAPPKGSDLLWACEQNPDGVLFVDEVHCWSKAAQHQLMQLTESGTLDTSYGTSHFEKLTVIAATTEPDQLLMPLVDRFGCKVTLDPYSTEEMVAIAAGMVKRCWPEGFEPLDDSTLSVLAAASAGVPRDLRSLLFAGRDLAYAGQQPSAAAILRLCDTDPDGCTRAHLDLLAVLADSPRGVMGQAVLASMLRVPPDMLRRSERLLVDRGYLLLTPAGRQITSAGRRRLAAGSIRDAA